MAGGFGQAVRETGFSATWADDALVAYIAVSFIIFACRDTLCRLRLAFGSHKPSLHKLCGQASLLGSDLCKWTIAPWVLKPAGLASIH